MIHPNTIIEKNVFIQHHVTTGVRWAGDGYPIIRKGASFGAYAIIWGPIEIGENATIGARNVVTYNVSANTIYYNKREHIEKAKRG